MINSFDSSMNFPYTLFETVRRFNDTYADDMRYGDMSEPELLLLGLEDISATVDPYRLIRYKSSWRRSPIDMFKPPVSGIKISHQECVDVLFSEMKELSQMFSFQGEYKTLIGEMIDHFRFGNGSDFYSQKLNMAFHKRINSYSRANPLSLIKDTINNEFNSKGRSVNYPLLLRDINRKLLDAMLPKFNETEDRFNGLGITIHDIAAQKITILDLQQYAMGMSATIHFDAQDHFGLDVRDIKNKFYKEFRFFRIWFFLQRHRDFAFKPFFTNFHSIEKIESY